MLKAIYRSLSIILAFVLCLTFCLTSCEGEKKGNEDESSSGDVAVMGTPEESEAPKYDKRVALTFDDGPHTSRTVKIVDELSKYGYNATFFVVGDRVDGSSYNGGDAMKYAYDAGNEIAIHGYTHSVYYNKCSDSEYKYEISETVNAIKRLIPSYTPTLMRPIGGAISQERIDASEYSIVLWSVDSEDWKHKYVSGDDDVTAKQKVDIIVENVMSQVRDGDIILMHDIYESTYDAVVIILERLNSEGYDVVTVSELIGDPKPATRYSSGR